MDNKEIRRKILKVLYDNGKAPKMPKGDLKKKLGIEYDELEPNIRYLKSMGYIDIKDINKAYYAVQLNGDGIYYFENGKDKTFKSTVTQHFHGNVENLALGDINTHNTTIYFDALIKTIEESKKIPEEDKKSLIDKIKTIAHDPYVSGIGASAIFEGIKALSMGVKPF